MSALAGPSEAIQRGEEAGRSGERVIEQFRGARTTFGESLGEQDGGRRTAQGDLGEPVDGQAKAVAGGTTGPDACPAAAEVDVEPARVRRHDRVVDVEAHPPARAVRARSRVERERGGDVD